MSHLIHPTRESLELAAERALESAELVLGQGLLVDPAEAVGALMFGLRLYCIRRAGGSHSLLNEAIDEHLRISRLVDQLEASAHGEDR